MAGPPPVDRVWFSDVDGRAAGLPNPRQPHPFRRVTRWSRSDMLEAEYRQIPQY
jgi:hypothetical protein